MDTKIEELKGEIDRLSRMLAVQIEFNLALMEFMKAEVVSVNTKWALDSFAQEYTSRLECSISADQKVTI